MSAILETKTDQQLAEERIDHIEEIISRLIRDIEQAKAYEDWALAARLYKVVSDLCWTIKSRLK